MALDSANALATAGAATGALGSGLLAVFASACCTTPLVFALFGASGALTAAMLQPYRGFLLVGATVLLIFGFWRTYTASAPCSTSLSARLSRGLLWLSAAVTVIATAAPLIVGALS